MDYYPDRKHEYGPVLADLIELGLSVEQELYDGLELVRHTFRVGLDELFKQVDVLISPCMTQRVPTMQQMMESRGEVDDRAPFITFTAPFDYSGHPTLTLPAGVSDDGLPESFQLIGPRLGEGVLVQAGLAYEKTRGAISYPVL